MKTTAMCVVLVAALAAASSCKSGGKSPTGPGPITSLALEIIYFQDEAANPGKAFDWHYQYSGIGLTRLKLALVPVNARVNYLLPAGCSIGRVPWAASITLPALPPTEYYWSSIAHGPAGAQVRNPCATVRGPKNSVSVTPDRFGPNSEGGWRLYQNNGTLVLG